MSNTKIDTNTQQSQQSQGNNGKAKGERYPKKVKIPGYKVRDKPRVEPDENLVARVDKVKDIMRDYFDLVRPECPECKKNYTKEMGTRVSFLVGTRQVYRCLNADCPRVTFTLDDSRMRNLAAKNTAMEMVQFGGKEFVPQAKKFLRDYAVNPENMPYYQYLKEQSKET